METITSESQYEAALENLNLLMKIGEENISDDDTRQIEMLGLAIQAYERIHYPYPMPKTIPEMLELRRLQLKLTQAALAKILGLGKPELAQIMNGKLEPDVTFLKAVYHKLGVDPAFLLDKA
ncbi:helix-turn-helix domain-containing protein [Dyadobacter aurulentus]|uniref:helix-turn-helix domain-containing protein n=1 Tax=Dyadobacter sp. UC 10 TaxID=2605428 RepID=UPI0011F2C32D|nr:helix-turn-helix domain-containing protein [Dyadobacter sp. UC 10]KAA0993559.1 helix-turn-helix transcriptional regulator [Dyadobacter sp. UC 10]